MKKIFLLALIGLLGLISGACSDKNPDNLVVLRINDEIIIHHELPALTITSDSQYLNKSYSVIAILNEDDYKLFSDNDLITAQEELVKSSSLRYPGRYLLGMLPYQTSVVTEINNKYETRVYEEVNVLSIIVTAFGMLWFIFLSARTLKDLIIYGEARILLQSGMLSIYILMAFVFLIVEVLNQDPFYIFLLIIVLLFTAKSAYKKKQRLREEDEVCDDEDNGR